MGSLGLGLQIVGCPLVLVRGRGLLCRGGGCGCPLRGGRCVGGRAF